MKNKLNMVAGLVFMVVSAFAFYWLWSQSQNYTINTVVADNLKPVEIETVKKDADKLLFGLLNKANLPIPTPLGKMGKENPFK